MKIREFDENSLVNYYSKNVIDFSWIDKPSQHQFRWRCLDGSWNTAKRRIRDHKTLLKAIKNDNPTDIYFSTSAWLNPVDLPRKNDIESPRPVMLDHLIVFDIDVEPFSQKNIEKAKKMALELYQWVDENCNVNLINISFSGNKGFHLIYQDRDRHLFSIENLLEREEAVKNNRMQLVQEILANGFDIDTRVTADTRRIIRLPGTINSKTGWYCHKINYEILELPIKDFISSIPKHPLAIEIPKNAKIKTKKSKPNDIPNLKPQSNTCLEVSNHLPGTKDRSAMICWLPKNWGDLQSTLDKAKLMIQDEKLGSCGFWYSNGRVLMICPRSIPRAKLVKIFKKYKFKYLTRQLSDKKHYWTRITGKHWSDSGWEDELEAISIIGKDVDLECVWQWSRAHVEISKRLGLYFNYDESNCSGDKEPSIRIVQRQ